MVDELRRGVALGLPHGFEDAGLWHPAEVVVDRWRPAGLDRIETDAAGQTIGVRDTAFDAIRPTAIVLVVESVDAKGNVMNQQVQTPGGAQSVELSAITQFDGLVCRAFEGVRQGYAGLAELPNSRSRTL
jgi:hypothetical protein